MRYIKIVIIAAALALAGCADRDMFGLAPARLVMPAEPPIAAATYCEVMASQGGAVLWSSKDTRISKERADKLNAVWKLCPQYQPGALAGASEVVLPKVTPKAATVPKLAPATAPATEAATP